MKLYEVHYNGKCVKDLPRDNNGRLSNSLCFADCETIAAAMPLCRVDPGTMPRLLEVPGRGVFGWDEFALIANERDGRLKNPMLLSNEARVAYDLYGADPEKYWIHWLRGKHEEIIRAFLSLPQDAPFWVYVWKDNLPIKPAKP